MSKTIVLADFGADEQLLAAASAGGLTVLPLLDADTVFDACIAKSVRSATYAAARDRNIPILTEGWVHACAARGQPLALDEAAQFLLPPFAGLRICVTGFDIDERQGLKDGTEQNGGIYHAELTKAKCTHLIAASATSDKYLHAQRWRSIKIVSPAWFEQSIAAKVCLPEASFPVTDAGLAAGDAAAGEPRRLFRAPAARSTDEALCGTADVFVSTSTIFDPLYLSSCRVLLLGFSQASAAPHRELQEILWRGGGICVEDASIATHVVVAARADKNVLQETPPPPGCKVVSEQWLRACKATSQLLPVDRFLLSSAARPGTGTFREPGARVPAASAPARAGVKEPDDDVDSATFTNKSFWLAPNLEATEKAEAESLVVRGGGTLQRGSEPSDANYAVFPLVLYGDEANAAIAGIRVTVCWLRKCVFARHPVSADGDPTFSPLRAQATSVSGVEDVRLTLTMFEEPVRSAIVELCKLSNIKVSDRLIRHKTTHLLCCVSAGEDESDKLITARAWGSVRIISIDWLLQSIRTGRRAAETEYLVENAPAAPGRTAAAPAADTSEPSDTHRDAVTAGTSQLPAPSAADDPRPPQKPHGDEPDGMLDFVAKLTSVAKATGKRRAPGAELDSAPSGASKEPRHFAADESMLVQNALKLRANTRPAVSTISASQIEESQLQFGYGDAPGGPPADADLSGMRNERTRMRVSARDPLQRLFLGRSASDKAEPDD